MNDAVHHKRHLRCVRYLTLAVCNVPQVHLKTLNSAKWLANTNANQLQPGRACYRLHSLSSVIITRVTADTHLTIPRKVEGSVNLGTAVTVS